MAAEDPANPSDEIAVFQAYIDLINSERETIWARHNALLVANSLIIGALAISPTALWQDKWTPLAMIGAGLLISAAWLGITVQGWSAMKRHAELAAKFASARFKQLPNALDETLCDRAQTNIHRGLHADVSGTGLYPLCHGLSAAPCVNPLLRSLDVALTLNSSVLVTEYQS